MLKGDTFYKSHYSIFGIRVEFPGCKWSLDGPIINIWDPQAAALREHSPLQPYRSASPESSAPRPIGSNHTKLWQIHANTIEIWWNLPEHQYSFDIYPYSFDISIYLSSTLATHFLPSSRNWKNTEELSFQQVSFRRARECPARKGAGKCGKSVGKFLYWSCWVKKKSLFWLNMFISQLQIPSLKLT